MDHEEYNDSIGRPSGLAILIAVIVILSICTMIAESLPHHRAVMRKVAGPAADVLMKVAGTNTMSVSSPRDKWLADAYVYETLAISVLSDCKYANEEKWEKANCAARIEQARAMGNRIEAEYLALPK